MIVYHNSLTQRVSLFSYAEFLRLIKVIPLFQKHNFSGVHEDTFDAVFAICPLGVRKAFYLLKGQVLPNHRRMLHMSV